MTRRLTVLVVDDEPLAREGLAQLVRSIDGCDVVGVCASGSDAVERCTRQRPEVVLLDIEMPRQSGLAVVRTLGQLLPREALPYVILVTAFEEYALQAFALGVRDYVLKPVSARRLNDALREARIAVEDRGLASLGRHVRSLATNAGPVGTSTSGTEAQIEVSAASTRPLPASVVVRDAGRARVVPLEAIEWIEAEGYYARLHVGAQSHLMRESLDSLAGRLPSAFVRVHRSSIIHVRYLRELRTRRDRRVVVTLANGREIEVSRRRLSRLRVALRAIDAGAGVRVTHSARDEATHHAE